MGNAKEATVTDMPFREISIHAFLVLSFLPNLTSAGNQFYIVETSHNEERIQGQDQPIENGHDYSETYELEGENSDLKQLGISASDYAEMTYAYGALGYDYNSPGKWSGSTGGAAVPKICQKCKKMEQFHDAENMRKMSKADGKSKCCQ